MHEHIKHLLNMTTTPFLDLVKQFRIILPRVKLLGRYISEIVKPKKNAEIRHTKIALVTFWMSAFVSCELVIQWVSK